MGDNRRHGPDDLSRTPEARPEETFSPDHIVIDFAKVPEQRKMAVPLESKTDQAKGQGLRRLSIFHFEIGLTEAAKSGNPAHMVSLIRLNSFRAAMALGVSW